MTAIRTPCHFPYTRFPHLFIISYILQILLFPDWGFQNRIWVLRLFFSSGLCCHFRVSPQVLNFFSPSKLITCYFLLSLKWFSTCCESAAVLLSLFSSQPDLQTAQCAWCSVSVTHFPVFPGGYDGGRNH